MIQFKRLVVHNFGSYGHTELDLQNRGFCLVSGQNNYTKDNALSNGAGKSFLWSAICFAMTGETINGIKTNLKNINVAEDDCYIQLEFTYGTDDFTLLRTVAPKSDLKITKNEIDVSGKGIRESEKKLQELLPDLTKDLIASTIIIGQGMPNKFSSFSPSGRKELLEKLTKSDFMIEDLKARITARHQELASKLREFEDSLIANNTQLNIHSSSATKLRTILEQQVRPDFDTLLSECRAKLTDCTAQLAAFQQTDEQLTAEAETVNQRLLAISEEKAKVCAEELAAYSEKHNSLNTERTRISFAIAELEREIKKLHSITDTCPTCGQHLPNVTKPDTSKLEHELDAAKADYDKIKSEISDCENKHTGYQAQINAAFTEELNELNNRLTTIKQNSLAQRQQVSRLTGVIEGLRAEETKLLYDQQHWDNRIEAQKQEIASHEAEMVRLTNIINITSLSKDSYAERLAIIKKMDTLIRRDFRGYLLTNIIAYLDSRAKEYCNTVFGTKELTLCLNGNALDITYCGKIFDGLSGGEKQRVDLILQLAIRDMLTSYLDLSANILVLDEITDFLDKKSCKAVMQLLETELNTVESVFIISHHADELELPIDSEIRVIKNAQGISEVN